MLAGPGEARAVGSESQGESGRPALTPEGQRLVTSHLPARQPPASVPGWALQCDLHPVCHLTQDGLQSLEGAAVLPLADDGGGSVHCATYLSLRGLRYKRLSGR